jgi:predicted ATPase/DNA-binding CsgD family transcriptional regulator
MLPQQLTAFIGRESDLADLRLLLNTNRLVTMTGAGGCGKSRLASELAGGSAAGFPHGVWWVDLAGVVDAAVVPSAVAAILPLPRGGDATAELIEGLRERRTLIVLDNCEQVVDGCASLVDGLLRACGGLKVLCTSRQPLDVDGEVIWRVPALSVPDPAALDPESVQRSEAVQLFLERATRRRPEFTLDAVSAPAVASICRRLDGLPLAIELAAASMSSMTPQQIDAAVADHLIPVAAASPGRPPRHQTLEASIDWSHQRLSADERILFRRLSVFWGSFTIDAARQVCGEHQDVLPVLTRLVDRSLLHLEELLGGRYRLLQTVRRYASIRLVAAAEGSDLRHRHLDFCLDLAGGAAGRLDGPDAAGLLDLLEAHRDDLLAAIDWALRSGRLDDARTLAADLLVFWMVHYPAEGLARLEAVIEEEAGDPVARARAQSAAAWLALYGPFDAKRSLGYARQAVSTGRQAGRTGVIAAGLNHLGWAAVYAAPAEARPAFEEAAVLHERHHDLPRHAHALAGLGFVAVQEGDGKSAEDLLARSLATARGADDEIGVRRALAFLGAVAALRGDLERAEALLDECLERARRLGDRYFVAHALDYLALVAAYRGALETGDELLREALATARLSSPMALARTLIQRAHVAFLGGNLEAVRANLLRVPAGAWGVNWYLARRLPLLAETSVLEDDLDVAAGLIEDALSVGADRPWARALAGMAHARLLRARGSLPDATAAAHEALATFVRIGHRPDAVVALELLAHLRGDAGHAEEAARLLGAASGAREQLGLRRAPVHDPDVRATTSSLHETLGATLAPLLEAGSTLSLEEALGYGSRGRGKRRRPPAGWESLTPAEHQVAGLVAEGLSNTEIAERLFISPATVRAHLGHVYGKLGIASRAQLAAGVARREDSATSTREG